jgi:phage nucleotide-binding protein
LPIEIRSTKDVGSDGIKCLVFGKAGIGKTTLMRTAPRPIVLSCESGLLALKNFDIPYIEIKTMEDLNEAFEFLNENDDYATVCLDSITEIAQVLLTELLEEYKDPRQAYGELSNQMSNVIRLFRDMKGKNVIFSAQRTRITDDDTNTTTYLAAMPGKTLLNSLPFFFDEVFYMTTEIDDEGVEYRVLKTTADFGYDAKDRSGELDKDEVPDLSIIFKKIAGVYEAPAKKAAKKSITKKKKASEESAEA